MNCGWQMCCMGKPNRSGTFAIASPLPGPKSGLLIVSVEDGTGKLISAWSTATLL